MNHRALALKALYYDFNKITSLRCIFGSNMNFSVSKLSLRNCILRDQDCNFLKNCRYLEELDIGMKSLEVLDLYNNKLKSLDHDLICTNLKCLDVEQNCFDTTQWHFLAYEEMRHKLRLTLVLENREDGVLKSNDANYQDNSEEELSEDSEDWDKELELEQITLSDDEWNGEAPSLPHIPINFYEKPSIYNDDVIFCDAD
ncbi:uncharacterized protein LOC123685461 isoform X2 [Harmonia axyridis]|uniref:uncharacterized protein LOC123685461 isoform X2 n=1 Tax=Harmonia axyridis TaxID=115357 RepID=UPI001E2784EF|nr:uncharacterized protein LOC123685461 isoform X2 [Harmonia axyridis]